MKLVVQEAPALKAAIDSIVCLVEEGQFDVKSDGLLLKAMDPSQISMISFSMPKSAFMEYNVPEETKIGVNISQLAEVLARGKKGERLGAFRRGRASGGEVLRREAPEDVQGPAHRDRRPRPEGTQDRVQEHGQDQGRCPQRDPQGR